jgi:hypothetical protein
VAVAGCCGWWLVAVAGGWWLWLVVVGGGSWLWLVADSFCHTAAPQTSATQKIFSAAVQCHFFYPQGMCSLANTPLALQQKSLFSVAEQQGACAARQEISCDATPDTSPVGTQDNSCAATQGRLES